MQNQRIFALDGVRGYAAIAVLIYHAILGFNYDLTGIVGAPIHSLSMDMMWSKFWITAASGESAVVIFFLLSGCVLTGSIAKDTETYGAARSALAFCIRRVLRIFPAVIAYVLICAAVMNAQDWLLGGAPYGFYDAAHVLRNIVLYDYDIGPTWTLQVEMLALPFIFAGGWSLARFGYIGPLAFLFASLIIHETPGLVMNVTLVSIYLFYMAIGALVPTEIGVGANRVAERIGTPALIVGFIFVRMFIPYGSIANLMQAAFGFLLLCLIVYGRQLKLTAFLTNPISRL